ncbi:hypothetical protein JW711_04895 [Candidatus Woesearchaeota archaeon]|nr:hypothetical protein [Candidatus Woesearchaeota archaeon]
MATEQKAEMGFYESLVKKINNSDEYLIDKRTKNPSPQEYVALGAVLAKRLVMNAQGRPVTVSVGGDCRGSTPVLKDAFIQGLLTQDDVVVLDLGYNLSTPSTEHSRHLGVDATVAITASHQEPDINGLKITVLDEYYRKPAEEIKSRFSQYQEKGKNRYRIKNAYYQEYLKSLEEATEESLEGLLVCVDAMNGAASRVFSSITRGKGAKVDSIRDYADGDFPSCMKYAPDPSNPTNLKDICDLVKKHSTDVKNGQKMIGFAFDGDADRIIAVTEEGKAVPPEYLGLVFAKYISDGLAGESKHKGRDIIMERKLLPVEQAVRDMRLAPVFKDTGRPNIIKAMKENAAPLGYELSGHIFTAEWIDDAMKDALLLTGIVKKSGKTLSALVDEACSTVEFNVGEVRFDYNKEKAKEIIQSLMPKQESEGPNTPNQDGLTITPPGKGDLLISNGTYKLYFRTSSNEDKVSAVPFGGEEAGLRAFVERTLSNVEDKFKKLVLENFDENLKLREELYYQPVSLRNSNQATLN